MPAFFNGVFGHKGTGGRIPNSGQFPIAENEALGYLCSGPIARAATDLPLLVELMQGPDGQDTRCEPMVLQPVDEVDVGALTVIDVRGNGLLPVHDDLLAAQQRVCDHLASRGATIVEATFPEMRHSLDIWSSMMQNAHDVSYQEMMGDGQRVNLGLELLKSAVGQSNFTLPSIGLAAIEKVTSRMPQRTAKMVKLGQQLKQTLNDRLAGNTIMVYPSYTRPAPKHGTPLRVPIQWTYTALLNVMELPVTQVPLGLNAQGLPLGIQVVAAHANDHLTLATAIALEDAFGGWVSPKL